MALAAVTLDDKYTLERGRAYLTGIQALVRLPMLQRQRDQAAGLNTGCFISGYRGSPLGSLDKTLWEARNRKSTRLNSSHQIISYAVFCLKKKKTKAVKNRRQELRSRAWI